MEENVIVAIGFGFYENEIYELEENKIEGDVNDKSKIGFSW